MTEEMTGRATISVEIELGWGFHDNDDPSEVPELSHDGQAEREALEWFLGVCDDAGVPVTFDVVGHLLLSSCDGTHDGPHPDDWFDRDPGTDAESDPLFYFPDVVDTIRDADVDHEICTHTFSHIMLDEVDEDVVAWELDRVGNLHDTEIVSLVSPRGREPSLDVLREHGIDVVRGTVDETPPSGTVQRYLWTLRRSHPVDEPTMQEGVLETRSSSFMTLTSTALSKGVSSPYPAYRVLPRRVRQRIHRQFLESGLERAVREESSIHYWTHLYNIANDAQQGPVGTFLAGLGRDEAVDVLRMKDLLDDT